MYRVLGYWTVYCTQSGGTIFFQNTKVTCILLYNLRGGGGGVSIFSPKTQKCHVYFCTTKGGGGSRRDPNHKSMYKCAYMYVHLSLSLPPASIHYFNIHVKPKHYCNKIRYLRTMLACHFRESYRF